MIRCTIAKITCLLFFVLLFGCNQSEQSNGENSKSYQSLKLFPEGKAFSGFSLVNQHNETWTVDDFKENYSVVFFGYANCPDICPTTLLDMQKIDKQLKSKQIMPPHFVFVSVDPDRDTPTVLNDYISYFNSEFIALTGDAANILSLTSQLGVAYRVAEHEKGDLVYEVDHASSLFVLNPSGERIGLFSAPHDIKAITADLITLLEKS